MSAIEYNLGTYMDTVELACCRKSLITKVLAAQLSSLCQELMMKQAHKLGRSVAVMNSQYRYGKQCLHTLLNNASYEASRSAGVQRPSTVKCA